MLILCTTVPAAPSGGTAQALDRCIASAAQGGREGLAELYRLTHAAVYGFALSIVKNAQDAEDVLQDVYLQVWQSAGGYRSQGKPMAWLLTIARNLSLSRLRERSRTVSLSPEGWQARFAQTPAVTQDDRLALEALLEVLSDEERQVVALHAIAGLKHRETARLLSLPLSTVLSKYHRALKKLQFALKEECGHA